MKKLTHVNLVIIEGVGVEDFTTIAEKYSSFESIFSSQLEFTSPLTYNSTVPDELSVLAVSSRRQKQFKEKFGRVNKACQLGLAFKVKKSEEAITKEENRVEEIEKEKELKKGKVFSPDNSLKLKLLLSLSQLIEENYPIPLKGPMKKKYSNYVQRFIDSHYT